MYAHINLTQKKKTMRKKYNNIKKFRKKFEKNTKTVRYVMTMTMTMK